jgi:hypothetical protein
VLYAGRSFFGVSRVIDFHVGGYRLFYHGTTLHGMQSTAPGRRHEPLGYFHLTGPLGQVFESFTAESAPRHVAVVGLGAGSVACYARPGQGWTFYEIDPVVEAIARDPRYFTYLQDCALEATVVLGDGRLSLAEAPLAAYDLIVLDAYTSDALPLHLITREALEVYVGRLSPNGLLVFNITNEHLDLEPVLAALARDADLASRVRDDAEVAPEEVELGKINSKWLVMARTPADLGPIAGDPRWTVPRFRVGARIFTDDYASLWSVLRLD